MARLSTSLLGLICLLVLAGVPNCGAEDQSKDAALQTSVAHKNLAKKAAALKTPAAASTTKHAHVALAALKHGEAAIGAKLAAQQHMSAKFSKVHSKQAAKERLGQKAQTYASEQVKSAADATSWMPFVLPPMGLLLLGGITFGVVTIRKWQKIPSMPTQGRMDIKDVQASARQMGAKGGGESREMGRSWENL